jgi:dihydrofolate reductase
MGKVFFQTGISLDGFLAGENGGPQNPLGDNGQKIHEWMHNQKTFLKMQGKEGGETNNPDDYMIEEGFANVGAFIMGKRMFDEGEAVWTEDLFKKEVFVLTKQVRDPWVQKGSTIFYFINEGINAALERANKSSGGKDIRVMGGAHVIQQYLNAGLIDFFTINIAPVFLGKGVKLFEHIDSKKVLVNIDSVISSPNVTHLKFEMKKIT